MKKLRWILIAIGALNLLFWIIKWHLLENEMQYLSGNNWYTAYFKLSVYPTFMMLSVIPCIAATLINKQL